MRVVQNKQPHPEKVAPETKAEAEGEAGDEAAATEVEKKSKEKLIVSGVATRVRATRVTRRPQALTSSD